MAEHDEWTAADDARLRAALTSLRTDVEAAPLPDVRFVKARGMARRRRRFLALGAAAAVAAVVAGTVGYGLLGPDAARVNLPAARNSTTNAAPSPTTPATTPTTEQPFASIVPTADEWQESLGLTAAPRISVPQEAGVVECVDSIPDALDTHETVEATADNVQGSQVHWLAPSTAKGPSTAKAIADQVAKCALPFFTVTGVQTSSWPRLYSYTAGDAGSGWFAIVLYEGDVTLLQVVDPGHAVSTFTKAQVSDLAARAAARLKAHGGSHESTIAPPEGPKAINEKMTVTGPDPVPSSNLFVAGSQWASDALTGAAKTNAGPGALEGSTAVASCETDDQQAGIGGRVGVVSVRTGTAATGYLGRQRVQLDDATDAAVQQDYVSARLAEAKALYGNGCEGANYTVRPTAGPTDGTFRLDTVFNDGSPMLSEWVGVTAQKTPGAVSTVVITAAKNPDQGFAELDRLLALARQK